MPGKIKVKVLAGRNLPVMDRASDTTDAFVEIKFGGVTHKTDVCRKSLNPHWNNTEWYRFEVDESELQDEPLQLRLMDHDTYSANDAIGKVVISLAPLLAREANNVKGTAGPPGGAVMSGWIPVFDTMHGIRGELNVIVKVELFSDFNKYKTSSCGVQFFHCPSIPPEYRATSVHGFVEELVVNDDPEYQWIDKIRTPRASNEARQVAFIKLSNQVQRLVGLKAAELGANAVVGYQQEFDLEGEAGVVARAIGTAVSITPLPTPSQPLNIPPCTQQQLKKCLDILATSDDSVTGLSQYYQTHQEELQKMISILNPNDPSMLDEPDAADEDDDKDERTSRMSIHSYTGSMSLFQDNYVSNRSLRHLSEDQTDLNKLLNRKDDDQDSDSSGPIQKIKKLKTNFFTKRFSKRKRDRKDKKEKQDDQISLKSNSSETSRLSLADIKNEFKKRLKKPKIRKTFTNPDDEGVGMASILARSVIHAHTSLACIAETQDSEHSTQEALRRTSESEPNINVSDDDKPRKISMEKVSEIKNEIQGKTVPEIHFSSLKNMSSEVVVPERVRKTSESCPTSPMAGRSESLLKLPGDKGYFGSVSSALSGESSEVYSSSEEEDESSDVKTDSEEAVETTTSVVNSVLNHEANPAFIAQMERKLSILENVHPAAVNKIGRASVLQEEVEEEEPRRPLEVETKQEENKTKLLETKNDEAEKHQEKIVVNEPSTSIRDSEKCVPKPNMHHIKIHNPYATKKTSKSFSAPSSPVEKGSFVCRSSKRIKHQLAKLSKSNMIKSISHYSLLPKKKEGTKTHSQSGSTSNVPSRAPSDTVLGSLFLSYSDLLSLDKEGIQANRGICKSDEIGHTKVSMYIGSEPASRASLSGPSFIYQHREDHDHLAHKKEMPSLKPTGLIHTAMETILIDKVDTLLLPTSPDANSKNNKQFFDDVSEKLEEHKNRGSPCAGTKIGQDQHLTGSTSPRIVAMTPKRLSDDFTSHTYKVQDKLSSVIESKGLVHTAMETILMDKANVVLPETPQPGHLLKGPFHEDTHEATKHKHFLSTLKDKAHVNLEHVFGKHHAKKDNGSDVKFGGLVHAAIQTMLIDRAQSMMPDTPEPIPIRTEPLFDRGRRSRTASESQESTGLVHSAMQTMLIDKVQSVMPKATEPVPIHLEKTFTKHNKETEPLCEESTGMVYSAMQTMLIDKVQSVMPKATEPVPIHLEETYTDHKKETEPMCEESTGMVHSAMQTMLIDKVQSVMPKATEPVPIHLEETYTEHKKEIEPLCEDSTGMVHSAMQTMLIDKVQSVMPKAIDPVPIHLEETYTEHKKETEPLCEESTGMVHSAMQTMLIDKVQSVMPKATEPVPIHLEETYTEHKKETEPLCEESTGMVHSAMQTMFIDKVQSMMPKATEPVPIHLQETYTDHKKETEPLCEESTGMVHSAMQTMLMDKVQSVMPKATEPVPIHLEETYTEHNNETETLGEESTGMVHSAMQTMLIDKVQFVMPKSTEPIPIHLEETYTKPTKETEALAEESTGMVHSAMQTILMDKVQAVLCDKNEPIAVHFDSTDTKSVNEAEPQIEVSSELVHSAIQTMLIEKLQSVLPDTPQTTPIHLDPLLSNRIGLNPDTEIIAENKRCDKSQTVQINETPAQNMDNSKGLLHTAIKTILYDKVQTMHSNSADPDLITDLPVEEKRRPVVNESLKMPENEPRLVQAAKQTISNDKMKSLVGNPDTIHVKPLVSEDLISPGLVGNVMQTILMNKRQSVPASEKASKPAESLNILKDINRKGSQNSKENKTNDKLKKLTRQDSIHSIPDAKGSRHTSNEDLSNMSPQTRSAEPVLQHFHPILSGLETIPSMSESSFERSLDGESCETNSASVCDNSHAACGFGRTDRDRDRSEKDRGSPRHARHESYGGKDPVGSAQAQVQPSMNSSSTPLGIHRRSSDSDLSVTPKGGSLNTSAGNVGSGGGAILRPSMNTDNLDMLEYPFLTMAEYPPGFIVHIGGTVCARSVKLVDGGGESAVRAAWWAELRTELRAHARALRCNAVIAYTDTCSICEDVCVLSASGTAAVINLDCDYNVDNEAPITVSNGSKTSNEETEEICSMAHVPYSPGTGPYRAELSTCGGCRRARVPAVLLATCAKPNRLMSYNKAVTLTAVAARVRRAQPSAEPGARDISDQLPFLEYELHKLLLAKLRMQGANALFSLQTQIAIGERCVMALASGTAVKLAALPPPTPPRIKATENDKDALEMQRKLWDSFSANKTANGYDIAGVEHAATGAWSEVEHEAPALDLCADKDACVLELDEHEDVETARMLCARRAHTQAFTCALRASDKPPHAFAQVSRARLALSNQGGAARAAAERHVARALDSVTYKLRRLHPTALTASFQLELPEDEIQLVVFGTAIPLMDPSKVDSSHTENGHAAQGNNSALHTSHNGTGDPDDDIFTLDEEQLVRNNQLEEEKQVINGQVPTAVALTTLSQISGVKITRRVCALRLLFVRETTAVRELGGLSGFLHTFTCEVLAIARAYTAALGGNALTSFYIRQLMLQDNAHKNQGQCLLSVGGDIVHITY